MVYLFRNMAKLTAEIMEGDEESDLEYLFVTTCGLNYNEYLNDDRILTRSLVEDNYDKIMEIVKTRSTRRVTFLVLGYLFLLTGANLSNTLKYKIIDSTKWEHEKDLWNQNLINERKFYLKDLEDKIRNHKAGQITRLVKLKNINDEDFNQGIIGITQFLDFLHSEDLNSVKHINLDSCNLSNIPDAIFDLKSLETLSLDNNNLDFIPDSIGDLKSLRKLFIEGNRIEEIPDSIGKLNQLEDLFMARNNLIVVPTSLACLKNLKILDLENNKLSSIPASLGNLKKLNLILLNGNPIKTLPNALKSNLFLSREYPDKFIT